MGGKAQINMNVPKCGSLVDMDQWMQKFTWYSVIGGFENMTMENKIFETSFWLNAIFFQEKNLYSYSI